MYVDVPGQPFFCDGLPRPYNPSLTFANNYKSKDHNCPITLSQPNYSYGCFVIGVVVVVGL